MLYLCFEQTILLQIVNLQIQLHFTLVDTSSTSTTISLMVETLKIQGTSNEVDTIS